MAKVIITLEDTGENLIQYKSECDTPQETDSKGEPTLALKLGGMIMQQIMALNVKNEVE